ncbi:MAG: glucose-6-phosphate dehydrogenase assembly protein OpcA [Isosphaeraceae bacterium]
MTADTSDAFLSGQGIPVDLARIDAELAGLWGPAAEREGGPDLDHPAVTRIAQANLIIGGLGAAPGRIDGVLDSVVARYPCRAILLRQSNATDRAVHAEASAMCHLPAPGLPQVCSERIVLHAGSGAFDLLPGAVRPLLEPGLPVVLWWLNDPRAAESVFRTLAEESTRLILDLPESGTDLDALRLALDVGLKHFGRDTAWFGISGWRELIAQLFDPPGSEATRSRIAKVQIRASRALTNQPPRGAAWLLGWLAGQLGWKRDQLHQSAPGTLTATFLGPSGPITTEILTEIDPNAPFARITGVALTTREPEGEGTFRLDRLGDPSLDVRVEVCAPDYCDLPRFVRTPEADPARSVAAALESARDDPPYRHALPHALWLLGG